MCIEIKILQLFLIIKNNNFNSPIQIHPNSTLIVMLFVESGISHESCILGLKFLRQNFVRKLRAQKVDEIDWWFTLKLSFAALSDSHLSRSVWKHNHNHIWKHNHNTWFLLEQFHPLLSWKVYQETFHLPTVLLVNRTHFQGEIFIAGIFKLENSYPLEQNYINIKYKYFNIKRSI